MNDFYDKFEEKKKSPVVNLLNENVLKRMNYDKRGLVAVMKKK